MEVYLMIARSVTHAQRMQMALSRAGIRAQIFHAPLELTGGRGCAYAVQVRARDYQKSVEIVRGVGLIPVQIYQQKDGKYQEVRT